MSGIASRTELEKRLRGVVARLIARQLARAAFSGLAGGGISLGLGVLFMDVLPRLMFSTTGGVLPIAACALVGLTGGVVFALRRFRAPTLQDAALALEARLKPGTGALGAALRVGESNAFYRPLIAQAGDDFVRATELPAPVLIPTARLVVAPGILLVSLVAFVWAMSAGPPDGGDAIAREAARTAPWAPLDVGGGRSDADRAALRDALGMKETAATLNHSAATLRDAGAGKPEKQRALDEARAALDSHEPEAGEVSAGDLPGEPPDDAAGQSKLADRLDAIAAGMNSKALRIEGKAGAATVDSGGDGDFNDSAPPRELTPFPEQPGASASAQALLAVQTPQRRALSRRAVEALEEIRNE